MKPGVIRFGWFACYLILAGIDPALSQAQGSTATYIEPLTIEWGEVRYVDGGVEAGPQLMWFMRRPPSFALGTNFSAEQQAKLSNCLATCVGTVGNVKVWRVDDACLNGEFTACVMAQLQWPTFQAPTPPDPWESGPQTNVPWDFEMEYELPVTAAPPSMEVALFVEEVPAGEAWEVIPAAALTNAQVKAKVSAAAEAGIIRSAEWARLFLVSPSSLASPGRDGPTIKVLNDPSRFAVPVAFGLNALAAIDKVFGTNRSFEPANLEGLRTRLTPDSTNAFPGAALWFPEPDGTRQQLEVADIETELNASDLVQVFHPTTRGVFTTERVLPQVSQEWAIRIGPFRRMQPARARVGFVQGKDKKHPVEELDTLLLARTNALLKYKAGISIKESELNKRLEGQVTRATNFFWLPELAEPEAKLERAKTLRSLEWVRLIDGVAVNFETNRFVYVATYRPSPIHLKLGASYNPDLGFGGELEAGWSGLLRPGDVFSVKGSIAQRAVEGDLSYKLPYHRSLDRQTTLGLELLGQAGKNENFRLGSLSPRPFDNQYQLAGLEHELVHQSGAWSVTMKDSLLWNAQDLRQSGVSGSIYDAGLLLRHRESWRYTPATEPDTAIGWEYNFAPSLAFGPEVGWSRSFFMGSLALGAKASFAGANLNGMYASARASFGAGTAGLPPALLYRLGDSERLLGLEPGEFSGDVYGHGELAYGLNLSHYVLGPLFKKPPTPSAAVPPERPEMPPTLQDIFVKLFAEVGAISSDENAAALDQPRDVLSTFGVAIEKSLAGMGGAAFTIGYAWSPDNTIHSHGRVFTGLSWSF